MKITSTWKEGFKSIVDNGRDHDITMDLPYLQHGKDEGPTALEVSVMGYAGCITTIYKMMADKMKLQLSAMKCELIAEKGEATIERVQINLHVTSDAPESKLQKAFEMTANNCPVGVLFIQAGVKVEPEITISRP